MASLTIAENATGPTFTLAVKLADGGPKDLTGSTVAFYLYNAAEQLISSRACVLDADPTTGQVTWTPEAADTDEAELRKAWLREVDAGGKVLWHPTPGHISVTIAGNLS